MSRPKLETDQNKDQNKTKTKQYANRRHNLRPVQADAKQESILKGDCPSLWLEENDEPRRGGTRFSRGGQGTQMQRQWGSSGERLPPRMLRDEQQPLRT